MFNAGDVVHSYSVSSSALKAHDVAVQADGKPVVVGTAEGGGIAAGNLEVARYLVDGGLDPSFGGGDGVATYDFGDEFEANSLVATSVAIDAQGRIVGTVFSTNTNVGVIRFNNDGTRDTSFGVSSGRIEIDEGGDDAAAADGRAAARSCVGPGRAPSHKARHAREGSSTDPLRDEFL